MASDLIMTYPSPNVACRRLIGTPKKFQVNLLSFWQERWDWYISSVFLDDSFHGLCDLFLPRNFFVVVILPLPRNN